MLNLPLSFINPSPSDDIAVVRLKTSYWASSRGLHQQRNITYMKRLSEGWHPLQDDSHAMCAEDIITAIANLDQCKDGLYEVVIINIKRDYETGDIEQYDYMLLPYEPR